MSNIKLEKLRDRIIQKYGSDYNNSFIVTNHLTIMQNNLKRFTVHQTFNNRIRIVNRYNSFQDSISYEVRKELRLDLQITD